MLAGASPAPETRDILKIKIERDDDGCWIGEVLALPDVLAYGQTVEEVRAKAEALGLRATRQVSCTARHCQETMLGSFEMLKGRCSGWNSATRNVSQAA